MPAVFMLHSGIDLVEIKRLAEINPAIRQRFLQRVYTPLELADAGDSNVHLAGRFAAKEAVSKALGTGIGEIAWKDIEIQRGPKGEPVLQLYGSAAALSEKLGLFTWSISISHTQTHAVAMAVACGPVET
jgi:holo-[acyl-carrier protein] synthase